MTDDEVVVCPVCGYPNDAGAWRCQGTVTRRGDQKTTCRKDLTGEDTTLEKDDVAIHGPGGAA